VSRRRRRLIFGGVGQPTDRSINRRRPHTVSSWVRYRAFPVRLCNERARAPATVIRSDHVGLDARAFTLPFVVVRRTPISVHRTFAATCRRCSRRRTPPWPHRCSMSVAHVLQWGRQFCAASPVSALLMVLTCTFKVGWLWRSCHKKRPNCNRTTLAVAMEMAETNAGPSHNTWWLPVQLSSTDFTPQWL